MSLKVDKMPGSLWENVHYGGMRDFPVDRDGWSRSSRSAEEDRGVSDGQVSYLRPSSDSNVDKMENKQTVSKKATIVSRTSSYKPTRETSAPRMRTHAEIRAARLKREQKKKISAARVIQEHARKWLERNTIQILRRRLSEKEEESSKKDKEIHELRMELHVKLCSFHSCSSSCGFIELWTLQKKH